MSATDETFARAVADLRAWLDFLEEKEGEFQEQLERARRKAEDGAAEQPADGEASAGNPPGWL